ncbi:MAG: NAD-dependent malic enzyme [Gemmatimonadetes bacterium]|nr:NAD-dependent malic enzyme [Gemmatimonadota bacterium]
MTGKTEQAPTRQKHGLELLHDPRLNKGTAFTERERDILGLHGLLPGAYETMEQQLARALEHFEAKQEDLERYIYMTALSGTNETLFFRLLREHIERLMPIVYTPTVGQACQQYGHIFRRTRGMYVSIRHKGRVREILDNWPESDVRVAVVTDGERILGLGDLGTNGMGIPIGKLCLYTACAGIAPSKTLPVTFDTGTGNDELMHDTLYLGIREPRIRGAAYDELIEEFVAAANDKWPGILIQFEDFAKQNSFRLLNHFRDRICTFNDDIQGTASVTLAGIFSALRITGGRIEDQRILFLGAGGAAIGIGDLVVSDVMKTGVAQEAARRNCWFVDSHGLVEKSREGLDGHKLRFAHDMPPLPDLMSAIRAMKPTILIGVSGQGGAFTQEMIAEMAAINERPIVLALSNPTSAAECTAEQAYRWSDGRAVYASGSPFDPVEVNGTTLVPGQGNNVYIFPGLGLGVISIRARHVTDAMFAAAARTLADIVSEEDLAKGRIFPPLTDINEISLAIAVAVAEVAFESGLATVPRPADLKAFIEAEMYVPEYRIQVD